MKITVYLLVFLSFISCGVGGGGVSSTREQEKYALKAMDEKPYIDLSAEPNNANTIDKVLFMENVEGVYRQGEAFIKFNRLRGTVEMFNPQATIPTMGVKEFRAIFSYSVFPASKNILYIKPANTGSLMVRLNNVEYKAHEIPDLITCVPFYGFGGGRLEVTPDMNGYIAMPSGTYWNKK